MRPRRLAPLLLALAPLASGCWGSQGAIVAPRADLGFVRDAGTAFMQTGRGIERVSLDGRTRRLLFPTGYGVMDVSADFGTFVLRDSNTDLFLGDARTGERHEIPALRGRLSAAAISPDGRTVACSRHVDFLQPQGTQVDEDTIHLVDVATLEVRTLPKTTNDWPHALHWSADGAGLLALMAFGRPAQWITVETGERERADGRRADPAQPGLFKSPLRARPRCPATIVDDRWGTELSVTHADRTVVVARESGRSRGFHDHMPDFHDPRFSPDCSLVAFGFHGETWLAAASGSGEVARLGEGAILFFGPPMSAP